MNHKKLKEKYEEENIITWRSQYFHPNMIELTKMHRATDFVQSFNDNAIKVYVMCQIFPHLTMMECEAIVKGIIDATYEEWDGEKYTIKLKINGDEEE